MSDNAPVEPQPEAVVNNPPSQNENQSVSLNVSQAVNVCAAGLLGCFFLPWINFFLGKPSGFDFAKEGGKWLLFSAIPIFCILTIIAGITKQSQRVIARTTGELPFLILGYALYQMGRDTLRIIEFGGWASLALGLTLFFLSRRLK